MTPVAAILEFLLRLNHHDADQLAGMMTEGHPFGRSSDQKKFRDGRLCERTGANTTRCTSGHKLVKAVRPVSPARSLNTP
jgi:hypothetical protein